MHPRSILTTVPSWCYVVSTEMLAGETSQHSQVPGETISDGSKFGKTRMGGGSLDGRSYPF